MNKMALRVSVAALAIVFVSDVTFAASKSENRKRKSNIFTELFGGSSKKKSADKRKKRRNTFGRDWFDDGRRIRIIDGSDDGDVDIVSSPRRERNVVIVGDDDPEGDPGFGMGNLTYVAEPTVAMGGILLAMGRPDDQQTGVIFDALAASDAHLRVVAPIRDAVASFYAERSFKPLWTEDGKLSERAESVLKVLAAADEEGLDAASYLPPTLGAYTAMPPTYDPAALARLDIELTALAIKYARDASGGRFAPERLSRYHDVKPPKVEAERAMKVLGWSPYPADYLTSLHPSHPAYAAMKAELARMKAENSTVVPFAGIESGPVVKKGESDPRVEAVRERLVKLGFPQAADASGDPLVLDADLSVQLRLFQRSVGIGVDGMLGNQTVKALNDDHGEKDVARLLNNIERLRWLPRDLGQRYVFVNQAAFNVRVMDRGNEVWSSRVIVGKPTTQTVVFNDELETVVFNPSWGVPPSIIANEYLPKLRRDPSYLDRIGFRVVDARGKVVRSSSVDWYAYGSRIPYGIQQPPGGDNALGEIKFLFPNTHNIYMHDTPTRHLFEKDVRAYSHGCVRVQNPREFAQVLLGWDAEKVDQNVDNRRSQTVKLEAKIPVFLTYFTAWPDETGKIQYFNDIYERDKTMDRARAGLMVAQR